MWRFLTGKRNEPRGSDVIVGALLLEPHDRSCAAGVIFFNNVGTIGMCGTGTSAKLACLAADGKLAEGMQWVQERILGRRYSSTSAIPTAGEFADARRALGEAGDRILKDLAVAPALP